MPMAALLLLPRHQRMLPEGQGELRQVLQHAEIGKKYLSVHGISNFV